MRVQLTGVRLPQNIDPTLLLSVFLPILLFGSAFASHWHTVRTQKYGILLLAFPGAEPHCLPF